MVSEAQKRASLKYQKKMYRYKHVKLNIVNDKDILDWLDELNDQGETTNGYLKKLIRKDMEEREK